MGIIQAMGRSKCKMKIISFKVIYFINDPYVCNFRTILDFVNVKDIIKPFYQYTPWEKCIYLRKAGSDTYYFIIYYQ